MSGQGHGDPFPVGAFNFCAPRFLEEKIAAPAIHHRQMDWRVSMCKEKYGIMTRCRARQSSASGYMTGGQVALHSPAGLSQSAAPAVGNRRWWAAGQAARRLDLPVANLASRDPHLHRQPNHGV